jgi:hypothetical protein
MNIRRLLFAVAALPALVGWTVAPLAIGHSLFQDSGTPDGSAERIVVTVMDKDENPAPPPAKGSIEMRIGKQAAEVEEIRSLKDTPLIFSILVDVSGSSRQFAKEESRAAVALFRYLTSSNYRGYLVLFKSGLTTTDSFLDAEAVQQILTTFPLESRVGRTSLYDAITHAVTQQLGSTKFPKDPRRTIFVFSDGGDNASHSNLSATVKLAQKEGVSIFSIGLSSQVLNAPTMEEQRGWLNLRTLSRRTGGLATFLDEPGSDPARMAHLMDGQCLLSFKRPTVISKKSYALMIKSSDKSILLLAPGRYVP